MKIIELKDGMRRIDVTGTVTDKSDTREARSRYTNDSYRVADAILEDETGTVTLTLWNEEIDRVRVNDRIHIENGYTKSFKGQLQFSCGKYGTLTVL